MQFKVKLNLIKDIPNIKLSTLKSIINAPILKNDKVIGTILDYNLTTDEVICQFFNNKWITNFNQETNTIIDIEIKEQNNANK